MKKCSGCKSVKQYEDFIKNRSSKDGHSHYCKQCSRINGKKWRDSNPEKAAEVGRNYQRKNREHLTNYKRRRRQENIIERIAGRIRTRLHNGLKLAKVRKSTRTEDYLGCSFQELKMHLEKQFTPEMNWDNQGTYWHIDHIIPFAACEPGDQELLNIITHYTNLRPLEKKDNRAKSDIINLTLISQYGIFIPREYIERWIQQGKICDHGKSS